MPCNWQTICIFFWLVKNDGFLEYNWGQLGMSYELARLLSGENTLFQIYSVTAKTTTILWGCLKFNCICIQCTRKHIHKAEHIYIYVYVGTML